MKSTTLRRYRRIKQAAAELYGTMPVMHIYARLAEQFDLSESTIRGILAKKHPP